MKRKNLQSAQVIVQCPNCESTQTTELEKQPDCCTTCDNWYRVRTQIHHEIKLVVTKETRSDSKVVIDNPPAQGEKEK